MAYPNVLLVPLLMFTDDCHRLGYGGGYYDRTIHSLKSKIPNLLTIGLAFEAMKYDDVS